MTNVFSSERLIRCTALVGRQRAMVAQLRESGDDRTAENAERLLRSFERSLMALLAIHRRQREAASGGGQSSGDARRRLRNSCLVRGP